MTSRLYPVLLIATVLSGCANLPRVWLYGGYYEDAQTSAFRYSGADRDFRTSVAGNPFDGPKVELERAVIAAMQGEDKGMGTNFTLTPRTHYRNYHIVMLFNPAGRTGGGGGCASPRSSGRTGPGRQLVLAALFCDGDRLLFGVAGSRPGVGSVRDPGFETLVKDVMLYFVPQHSMVDEPDEENDND